VTIEYREGEPLIVREGTRAELAKITAYMRHGPALRTDGTPVIEHLYRVAKTVREHGGTDHEEAVAWLHDSVEDTDMLVSDIVKSFGIEVARDVWDLSEPREIRGLGGDWRHRRRVALAELMSPSATLVRLADIHDNAQTMREAKPDYFEIWRQKKIDIVYQLPRPMVLNALRVLTLDALGVTIDRIAT
jgi:(p)ppGpp synthase/HD superfamily hydrolase